MSGISGHPAREPPRTPDGAGLVESVPFSELPGWADDTHGAAFAAFLVTARSVGQSPPKQRAIGPSGAALRSAASAALAQQTPSDQEARAFFERHFRACRILSPGFVTGYFEPEVEGRRQAEAGFPIPLYRRPPDLVDIRAGNAPPGWDSAMRFARRTAAGPVPYFTRAEIEEGALRGQGLELAWLESPVDAFFIHVQGSARLNLGEGEVMRIAYDGKAGHPYTSIGKRAVERGLLPLAGADKDGLEQWLRAHPHEGRRLMHENRSFIFFREVQALDENDGPIGAAGVPLTAGRSLAVDRTLVTFGTPLWVAATDLPDLDAAGTPFRRLMIAQDTGSAILGPARGDIFVGSGAAAGSAAGKIRHTAAMFVLEAVDPAGLPP